MRANSVITAHLQKTKAWLTPPHFTGPLPSAKLTPDPCSRQVPVELLHRVVEDFVGAGEGDLGGPLGDRRLLGLRWEFFSARHRAVYHCGWIRRPLGLPLHRPDSTETAGGAESQA